MGENNTAKFNTRMYETGKSIAFMHQAFSKFPDDKIPTDVWRAPLSEEMINYRSSQILPYLSNDERTHIEPLLNNQDILPDKIHNLLNTLYKLLSPFF